MSHHSHKNTVAQIVSAFVANNNVTATALPDLINAISSSLKTLDQTGPSQMSAMPAMDPKRAIGTDMITCLECGRSFRSLRRHLGSEHGMTPTEYRSKWKLTPDYPMVAPSYAARRSELAKEIGLGRRPGAGPARLSGKHG